MVNILSALISIILTLIAGLHVLWGLRVWVPVNDEFQLARTVAGFSGIKEMPSRLSCFLVAACLIIATLLVLKSAGILKRPSSGKLFFEITTVGAALVFLMRGVIAYTPMWKSMTPEQPFRTLDSLYYSPLCLLLGVSIMAIVILKH